MVLFSGLLEAYRRAGEEYPHNEAGAVPSRAWEGWESIVQVLGVQGDCPAFRARQATKIVLAADQLNLKGEHVDWDGLEQRLEGILAGTASQLPETQEDLRRQAPLRAVILYDDQKKTRKRAGAATHNYYVVMDGLGENDGDWFTHEELKRQFPSTFREMKSEYQERVKRQRQQVQQGSAGGQQDTTEQQEATTTAAEPVSTEAATVQQEQEEQQPAAAAAVAAGEAGLAGELEAQDQPASKLASAGESPKAGGAAPSSAGKQPGSAAPNIVPGGSYVPRKEAPPAQPLFNDSGPPPSIMLAGIVGAPASRAPTASPPRRRLPPGMQPSTRRKVFLPQRHLGRQAVRNEIHPLGVVKVTTAAEPVIQGRIRDRTVQLPRRQAGQSNGLAAVPQPQGRAATAAAPEQQRQPAGLQDRQPERSPAVQQRAGLGRGGQGLQQQAVPSGQMPGLLAELWQRKQQLGQAEASLPQGMDAAQRSAWRGQSVPPLLAALQGMARAPQAEAPQAYVPNGWEQGAAAARQQPQQPQPQSAPGQPVQPRQSRLLAAIGRVPGPQQQAAAAAAAAGTAAASRSQPAPQPLPSALLSSINPLLRRNAEYAYRQAGRLPLVAGPTSAAQQRQPQQSAAGGLDALLHMLPRPGGMPLSPPQHYAAHGGPSVTASPVLPRPAQRQQQPGQQQRSQLLAALKGAAAVPGPAGQQRSQQGRLGVVSSPLAAEPSLSRQHLAAAAPDPSSPAAAARAAAPLASAGQAERQSHADPAALRGPPTGAEPARQEAGARKRERHDEPDGGELPSKRQRRDPGSDWGTDVWEPVQQQQQQQQSLPPLGQPQAAQGAAAAAAGPSGSGWSFNVPPAGASEQQGMLFMQRFANKAARPALPVGAAAGGPGAQQQGRGQPAQQQQPPPQQQQQQQQQVQEQQPQEQERQDEAGEEAFFDAEEDLPGSIQPSPAPAPRAFVPMSLDLRTQPDEILWTAADAAGLDLQTQQQQADAVAGLDLHTQQQQQAAVPMVPPTQVVLQGLEDTEGIADTKSQQEQQGGASPEVKEEQLTEGTAAATEQQQQEQQQLEAGEVKEEDVGSEDESEEEEDEEGLMEELLGPEAWATATIKGAKNRSDIVELWVEWEWREGYKNVVPSTRLLGRPHCMETLIQFYESKTRQPRKK